MSIIWKRRNFFAHFLTNILINLNENWGARIAQLVACWPHCSTLCSGVGWHYKPRSSLCSHAFHRMDSKDPDIHVLEWWIPPTKTHPAWTIQEDRMWLPLWLDYKKKKGKKSQKRWTQEIKLGMQKKKMTFSVLPRIVGLFKLMQFFSPPWFMFKGENSTSGVLLWIYLTLTYLPTPLNWFLSNWVWW